MLDPDLLNAYMEKGTIEVAPLAFMRGRTLNDSFVILDEAQTTSPEQMQMFLTRLGFGSRMIVYRRCDVHHFPRSRRPADPRRGDPLGSIEGIAFVRFTHEDVVRHKLVSASSRVHATRAGDSDPGAVGSGRHRGREPERSGRGPDAAVVLARRYSRPKGSMTATSASRSSPRTRCSG